MKNLPLTGHRCICPTCRECFNSVTAFDMHRIGDHAKGRRCLSLGEMYEKGMRENDSGYWVTKVYSRPD